MNVMRKETAVLWKVVKGTGGVTFVERKSVRIVCRFDNGEAALLADVLNRKEREIVRLKNELQEITSRT